MPQKGDDIFVYLETVDADGIDYRWYRGTVRSYDPDTNEILVKYPDGTSKA